MKSMENIVGEMLSANITSQEYFFDRHPELTQERKALHQGIIEDILSRKEYSRNKRVYMLGGAPANGKSRLLKSGFLPHPERALRVDVDEIKLELPEYRYMVESREPKAAVIIHDESSAIGYEIRQAALRRGLDLVWDGTADESLEHRKEVAAEFKAFGQNQQEGLTQQHASLLEAGKQTGNVVVVSPGRPPAPEKTMKVLTGNPITPASPSGKQKSIKPQKQYHGSRS